VLTAPLAGDIDRQQAPAFGRGVRAARHSAANAGSIMLTADWITEMIER